MSKARRVVWYCKAQIVVGPIMTAWVNAGDAVEHKGPFPGCTGCDAKDTARCEGAAWSSGGETSDVNGVAFDVNRPEIEAKPLPGTTAKESALIREHRAELGKEDRRP